MNRCELRADGMLAWRCPGCAEPHRVPVRAGAYEGAALWTWDGSLEAPTLSPSVLVTYDWGERREKRICHSFVRAGRQEFLSDCTHRLAGQTVEIESWPDDPEGRR